ncbi:MAG: hypothetical protein OEW09_10020, partial [Anaerolineae bacterium]|nr:hypothetical protein [Anaerolineae bacterium]
IDVPSFFQRPRDLVYPLLISAHSSSGQGEVSWPQDSDSNGATRSGDDNLYRLYRPHRSSGAGVVQQW